MSNRENFSLFTLNIRSLRKHFDELIVYLEEEKFRYDVIILTEIWVSDEEIARYNLAGYKAVWQCRDIKRSGGVVIYIKNSINFTTSDVKLTTGNFVLLKVQLTNKQHCSICGLYKFCDANSARFLEEFEYILNWSEE